MRRVRRRKDAGEVEWGYAGEVVMPRGAGYSPLGRMQRKRDLIAIKRHRRDDFKRIAQLLIVLEGHDDAADGHISYTFDVTT